MAERCRHRHRCCTRGAVRGCCRTYQQRESAPRGVEPEISARVDRPPALASRSTHPAMVRTRMQTLISTASLTSADLKENLHDIQDNVVAPMLMRYGRHIFFKFIDGAKARAWLRNMFNRVNAPSSWAVFGSAPEPSELLVSSLVQDDVRRVLRLQQTRRKGFRRSPRVVLAARNDGRHSRGILLRQGVF